jgi:putative drug exporter of the RND superfamily
MLARLADWSYRSRRTVVALWIAALLGAFALAGAFGGEYKQAYLHPGSESETALDTLKESFPERSGDSVQIVIHSTDGIASPEVQARAEQIFAATSKSEHVVSLASPFVPGGAGQISADGTTAYAEVVLDKNDNEFTSAEAKELVDPIVAAGSDTMQVEVGGAVAALSQTVEVGSEGIGLIAAAIILLVVFGSAVAMGLPLLTAVFGLGIAMSLSALMRHVVDVPSWAPAVAAMVGIGVGIDYALLIVTRFRSSLAEGMDPREATHTAMTTAGRAVLFAGTTVVVSMLGILLMGQPAMTGFAFSVVVAVLVVMAASVTLLPAILGFAGRNIERLHVPFVRRSAQGVTATDSTRWHRWSRFVQRRPRFAALGALAVLLALTAPFLGIRFGQPDAGNDLPGSTTREAHDRLTDGFGPGFSAPMLLVAQGSPGTDVLVAADRVASELRQLGGVAFVSPAVVNAGGDTAVLQVVATTSPQDRATEDLVDTLREDSIPAAIAGTGLTIHVGGLVPASLDSTRGTSDRFPIFIGGVLLFAFLLLMLVFRSVVVPLKAVVMNLLSSAAAFGVVALAVNGGPIGQLVGIPEAVPVPMQLPIGIFAILFGLSMDYEVFLLSRIKEEYDRTGDNSLAVADGLAKSARVITAGAAVMFAVFVALALGNAVLGKMFGIGLAAAILIDATIVRMVLVPATMELLGDRNWWLPAWLDRRLPHFDLEGRVDDEEPARPELAPV